MNKMQLTDNNRKGVTLTITGIVIMILLTATKVVPSSKIAGAAIFVGIAFFFIIEAVTKKRGIESGLRFNTIAADLKNKGVILWMLLPIVSAVVTLFLGKLIFKEEFLTHLMGRTDSMLSYDKIALLAGQVIIAAFGEEIAFRGFFFGKSSEMFPVWLCAVVSSIIFAAGHIAIGNIGIVIYDVITVFIDSMIYSIVYHKSKNCVISTFSHILANTTAIVLMLVLS